MQNEANPPPGTILLVYTYPKLGRIILKRDGTCTKSKSFDGQNDDPFAINNPCRRIHEFMVFTIDHDIFSAKLFFFFHFFFNGERSLSTRRLWWRLVTMVSRHEIPLKEVSIVRMQMKLVGTGDLDGSVTLLSPFHP